MFLFDKKVKVEWKRDNLIKKKEAQDKLKKLNFKKE